MTIKELMTPRFKLIADYPGNSNPIGSITIEDATASYFRKYTANFRELKWYEYRLESDLPLYLKFTWPDDEISDIRKVDGWLYNDNNGKKVISGFLYGSDHEFGPTKMSLDGWFPASYSEFLKYYDK